MDLMTLHQREQLQLEKTKPYPFWRGHKRAHTTANTHPNQQVHPQQPLTPTIPSTTLLAPKRLHERPPLKLEHVHTEEVPIVFLSPIRRERPASPLIIHPPKPTRSAPSTPWPLTPNSPPLPNLHKPLPAPPSPSPTHATAHATSLSLSLSLSTHQPPGPAPTIPLPPTPKSSARWDQRIEDLKIVQRSASERIPRREARKRGLQGVSLSIWPPEHTRSATVSSPNPSPPLQPPPKSPLRAVTPIAPVSPRLPHAPPTPLPPTPKSMSSSSSKTRKISPPPLRSAARDSLYPPALTPPPMPKTPTQLLPPPTPSSSSTAPAVMTSLLQEVLTVMDSIMATHQPIQPQDMILDELTELVVIMQQEAEDLLTLASLVEEFVEEVESAEQAAGMEEWALGSAAVKCNESRDARSEQERKKGHAREDSAVSLGAEDAFLAGELRESVYREVPIMRKHTPENREVREVRIGREAVLVRVEDPHVRKEEPVGMPMISAPKPRKLAPKKSMYLFRDSGLGFLSPKGSVVSRKEPKSPRSPCSPRWV